MKKNKISIILSSLIIILTCTSCSENYGNGKKFGIITKFSQEGVIWKSYEGHLNITQTGMNSSNGLDFSIDNDKEPVGLVGKLDSAAMHGWIVELEYHQVRGYNWFGNRGKTDIFITNCTVMQRQNNINTINSLPNNQINKSYDTLYVILLGKQGERIDISNMLKCNP